MVFSKTMHHPQFRAIKKGILATQLTNECLPFAIGLRDLIDAADLAVGHAPNDEDNDPWAIAYLPRALVFMPVTITGTEHEVQFYCHWRF